MRAQDPTLASFIRAHRDEIVATWERRVHALEKARRLSSSLLRDSVPEIVDCIAGYLESLDREQVAEPGERHGHERLREGFDLDEALLEIALLRDAVLEIRGTASALRSEQAIHLVRAFDPIVAAVARQYATRPAG